MKLENYELTEEEMLNDTLSSCKNLLSLLNIYATEASNEEIEDVIEDLYLQMKDNQRNLYKVMYKKGWYKLEKEDSKKINNAITKFNDFRTELK